MGSMQRQSKRKTIFGAGAREQVGSGSEKLIRGIMLSTIRKRGEYLFWSNMRPISNLLATMPRGSRVLSAACGNRSGPPRACGDRSGRGATVRPQQAPLHADVCISQRVRGEWARGIQGGVAGGARALTAPQSVHRSFFVLPPARCSLCGGPERPWPRLITQSPPAMCRRLNYNISIDLGHPWITRKLTTAKKIRVAVLTGGYKGHDYKGIEWSA
eukprot:gene8831-biopygen9204